MLYKRPQIHVFSHKGLAEDSTTLSSKEGGTNSKVDKTFVMKDFVALILDIEYRPTE
jgi:hypothetical protein